MASTQQPFVAFDETSRPGLATAPSTNAAVVEGDLSRCDMATPLDVCLRPCHLARKEERSSKFGEWLPSPLRINQTKLAFSRLERQDDRRTIADRVPRRLRAQRTKRL
jgi:hypothetical protein